jgi:hypothetical protein
MQGLTGRPSWSSDQQQNFVQLDFPLKNSSRNFPGFPVHPTFPDSGIFQYFTPVQALRKYRKSPWSALIAQNRYQHKSDEDCTPLTPSEYPV